MSLSRRQIIRLLSVLLLAVQSLGMLAAAPAADSLAVTSGGKGGEPIPGYDDSGMTEIDPTSGGHFHQIFDNEIYEYGEVPDFKSSRNSPVWGLPVSTGTGAVGSATVSIPVEVPKGPGGMPPSLSLVYSSLGGNGILGMGFSVCGLSVISRTPRDIYHDGRAAGISYTRDDALSLDGERLLLADGEPLTDGAVYVLDSSPFTRITAHGTGKDLYLTLQSPDGRESVYKNLGILTDSGNENSNAAWYLCSTADANGNTVSFSYGRDGQFAYIRQISYGGPRAGTTSPLNTIKFSYENRTDKRSFHLNGAEGSMSIRLRSIETSTGDSLYRRYKLRYSIDPVSGLSRLSQMSVANRSGAGTPVLDADWYTPGYIGGAKTPAVSGAARPSGEVQDQMYLAADLNGDGTTDVLELAMVREQTSGGYHCRIYGIPLWSRAGAGGSVSLERGRYAHIVYEVSATVKSIKGTPLAVSTRNGVHADLLLPELTTMDKSNRLRLLRIRGGKDGLQDAACLRDEILLASLTDKVPLCTAADFDNDGNDEVLAVEREKSSDGTYACTLFSLTAEGEAGDTCRFSVSLDGEPGQLFAEDFNNDGLKDVMLVTGKSGTVYLNGGGERRTLCSGISVTDKGITKPDLMEAGDFNGDGVPDVVMLKSGKLQTALGLGDGRFSLCEAQTIDGIKASDNKEGRSKMLVYDFNGDGRSDIVMSLGKSDLNTYWLQSEDTAFRLVGKSSAKDLPDNAARQFLVGDFNGDGHAELLNSGYDCFSATGAVPDGTLRLYPGGFSASTGKIKSVKDAFGNTTEIRYESLASGEIYAAGADAVFPVVDVTPAIPAVSEITRTNGAAGPNTTRYTYAGLKIHAQGKGVLGMTKVTETNDEMGTTLTTEVTEWDKEYQTPARVTARTAMGTETGTTETVYGITGTGNGSRFAYPATVRTTDCDGNTVTRENSYDTANGTLLRTRTTYDDGSYKETDRGQYVCRNGRWLPQTVVSRMKHADDGTEHTDATYIEYDGRGNAVKTVSHQGTDKEITTTSVYDTFGNVLRTSREAPGIPRVTRINEYDETGRFLTRTYTEPTSATIEYTYDIFGNVLLEEDVTDESRILATSHVYDSWGREAIRVQPDGRRSGTVWGWSGDDYGTYFNPNRSLENSHPWSLL